jgi:endoglucanase
VKLAPLTGLLPARPHELAADPGEVFPILAADSSCDAATISYQQSNGQVTSAGLTESTPDGTTLISSTDTTDGGCTKSGVRLQANVPAAAPPQFPLATDGRWIMDSSQQKPQRVKLASVNWYGAEEADFVPGGLQCQNVDTIAAEIAAMGFNSVRLPWSNAMYEQDPSTCTSSNLAASFAGTSQACIPPQVVAANPQFLGQSARSIYRDVVGALAAHSVMVILDNHSTDASFTPTPFDGIWWGGQFWDNRFGYEQNIGGRTQLWINDWVGMASMFASTPDVIGADLRNEPARTPYSCGHVFLLFGTHRCTPAWGGGNPNQDWLQAAEDAGNAILSPNANPHMLIFVEGTNSSQDFTKVYGQPVRLDVANHIVYSPHSYPASFPHWISYKDLSQKLDKKWGYILTQNRPWTAPIWVGEFGAAASEITTDAAGGNDCGVRAVPPGESWFSCFAKYLAKADIGWSYWAVNGTEGDDGTRNPHTNVAPNDKSRAFYSSETYGILDPSWSQNSSLGLIKELQALQPATQFP